MKIITKVDLSGFNNIGIGLKKLNDSDTLLRTISSAMLAKTQRRIHRDGLNSNNSAIGVYSSNYLKRRIKNGLGSSTKVILFYTGQMQRDYKIVKLDSNKYGLGFSNKLNFIKANVAEDGAIPHVVQAHNRRTKNKKVVQVKAHNRKGHIGYGKIYAFTENELSDIRKIIEYHIKKSFE